MTNTLEAALAEAFACLEEGSEDLGSVWHVPTLANVDAQGFPSQRSVVLRGWHAASRCLEIHTDTRSAKYAEFSRDERASLHGWDEERQVQLRMIGEVRLHVDDDVAQAAWSRLRPASRATYCVQPGPGAGIPTPFAVTQAEEATGFSVFCVMRLTVRELEWLHLEQGSHARARFRWDNGTLGSIWLVP